ncbi:hypothetical protein C5167_029237 [Papaver somniferum]|nr:hypothetical protein C5167_029237 [Papaver somniferum]
MRSKIGKVEGPELADWVFDGGPEESEKYLCLLSRSVSLFYEALVFNSKPRFSESSFFIGKGNQEEPVVTFDMENKSADVHVLKFELSLFETQILVNTPQGIL